MADTKQSTPQGGTDRAAALAALQAMRAQPPVGDDVVEAFSQRLTAQGGIVTKIAALDEVPRYISETFVKGDQGAAKVAIGDNPTLRSLPWSEQGGFELVDAEAVQYGGISVATAVLGVAETGSLVLLSGTENPTLHNFLPDYHVVVVNEADIVSHQEAMWATLRQLPEGLPRAVNLVSGPSSTGDVGVTFVFGAHGPVQVHALILTQSDR